MPLLRLMLAVLLGFFIPGALISRLVRCPEFALSSFLISILILFYSVFLLDILAIPLHFGGPFLILAILSGLLVMPALKQKMDSPSVPANEPTSWFEKLLVIAVGLSLLLLIVRSFLAPLSGYDTFFRWNFLPQQMIRFGNFDFYPPLNAEDFRKYFYVDGIPPLIPFLYWWLYAAFGNAASPLTGIVVGTQYALLLIVTFRLGKELSSRTGGLLAVAMLIACPLFFWCVFMGQETGMTALSLASVIYFLKVSKPTNHGAVIAAAFAAAVGGLSREYGLAFILCGVITAWQLKLPRKQMTLFFMISVALTAPWYLRNWILAGNPFYSNSLGQLFSVNSVHVGILSAYGSLFGMDQTLWYKVWLNVKILLEYAPLQLTVGLIAGFLLFKRFGFVAVCSAAVVFLWLISIGKTGGGYFWAIRVLSPALLLLSVCAGIFLEQRTRTNRDVIAVVFLAVFVYAMIYDFVAPAKPENIPASQWALVAFHPNPANDVKTQRLAPYLKKLNCRILSDDAYLHAGLFPSGIELVPVWSPEVSFLFEPGLKAEDARKRLIGLNIKALLYSSQGLNSRYLNQFAFFSQDKPNWQPYVTLGTSEVYLLP